MNYKKLKKKFLFLFYYENYFFIELLIANPNNIFFFKKIYLIKNFLTRYNRYNISFFLKNFYVIFYLQFNF